MVSHMSWKTSSVLALFTAAVMLLAPRAVSAQDAPRGSEALRLLLRAHHAAPSPGALSNLVENPAEALIEVVLDEGEPLLVRRRAVHLLSSYPGERVTSFLEGLLVRSPEGDLRRASARSLTRLLATSEPERLVLLLSSLLESADPMDREAAVWLVARLDTPAARRRLSRMRLVERNRAVVDALRRVANGSIPLAR